MTDTITLAVDPDKGFVHNYPLTRNQSALASLALRITNPVDGSQRDVRLSTLTDYICKERHLSTGKPAFYSLTEADMLDLTQAASIAANRLLGRNKTGSWLGAMMLDLNDELRDMQARKEGES